MYSYTAALGLALLLAANASGAVFTTHFRATIDNIASNEAQILGALQIGDPVSGYFTFDDSAAASLGNDRYAAEIGITLPTKSFTLATNYNYIRAENNIQRIGGIVDEFSHAYDSAGPIVPVNGLDVSSVSLRFTDDDASVFDGPQTLPVALDLADFESATWSFYGRAVNDPNQRFGISGTIDSLTIPEPATAILLTILAASFCCRRRQGYCSATA